MIFGLVLAAGPAAILLVVGADVPLILVVLPVSLLAACAVTFVQGGR